MGEMRRKMGIFQKLAGLIYNRKSGSIFDIINVIDVNRSTIRRFIETAAFNTKEGQSVLDAGAGEGNWRYLFPHAIYITQDKCIGGYDWDYSNIDYNCDITNIPVDDSSIDVISL